MLSIKIDRKSGKIGLYESKITRNFFFSNENDKEVAQFKDFETKRRLENGFVGFWIQYKFQEGYGGQLSVGLNGSPFTSEFAVVKWTDSSTTAIPSIKYIGFTIGNKNSEIHYGANCVLLNSNILDNYEDEAFSIEKSFDGVNPPLGRTEVLASTSNNPVVNPWNFVSTNPSKLSVGLELGEAGQVGQVGLGGTQSRPETIVLEPVIRGQYLTKLKRLLPTYFNDDDNEKILEALDQAYRSYK